MSRRGPRDPDLHLLFDLDDTLYPSTIGLFPLVAARIRSYIQSTLGVDERAARVVQRRYWKRYGTSLRGLMVRHAIEPEPFLEFVHGVPVEQHLAPDPELREVLARLPGRLHVFTNGPASWSERVLAALGIADLFEECFDIASFGYVPKPNPEPYDAVTRALGGAARVILIDDAPGNLAPAKRRGWRTVWVRAPESWLGGAPGLTVTSARERAPEADAVVEHLHDLPAVLETLRENSL